ncbi:hypothetical protein D3C80_663150 [compost metagenome]
MLIRALGQQPVRGRLNQSGNINGVRQRQRRVHHPHFDGTKMRAGANIPVHVFDGVDHAGVAQAAEQSFEPLPVAHPRHFAVIRKTREDVEPRRCKLRIAALHIRRGGRQGNKMGNKARQAVQQIDGVIAVSTAYVHVLTKHRRLQNEITKQLQIVIVPLIVTHFLTLPLLERMRPAAGNLNMLFARCAQDRLLHGGKLRRCLVDVVTNPGGNFEHAFGDIVFDLTGFDVVFDGSNQRRRVLAEIVARRVNHLQFEFNAQSERIGRVKVG